MITVVTRPFKSGGQFYPAGTIVDPAGFKLYKSRLGAGHLAVVDEHNLQDVSRYLTIRQKVENSEEILRTALDESNKPKEPEAEHQTESVEKPEEPSEEYLAKVNLLAEKFDVEVEGRPLEEVVAEIKEKAAKDKKEE